MAALCAVAAAKLKLDRSDAQPFGPSPNKQRLSVYLEELSDVLHFLCGEPSLGWTLDPAHAAPASPRGAARRPDTVGGLAVDEATVSVLGVAELCLSLTSAACSLDPSSYKVRGTPVQPLGAKTTQLL